MKQLTRYLRENIKWLTVILCIAMTSSATMLLNGISFTEIGYGLLLCGFITVSVLFVGFYNHLGRFACLEQMKQNILVAPTGMKAPESMYEQQYQDCIRILAREKNLLQNEMADRQRGMSEYYSMWVHQIKTPIAALKLLTDEAMHLYLDAEEAERHNLYIVKEQQKQQELFRIEQYVDMALQYTRLGAETNDFVIQQVRLDDVIKPSIHKYARQFIHKQLRLSYTPGDLTAVTDKKWLGFVIDQLLSNAVKYISIIGSIEGHNVLPADNKTTKYEHLIPQLIAVEENPEIKGLLTVLNTVGGAVEAGLALAELISTISKPTVSLVLGGGHSIGIPLSAASDYSFISETATMTLHPIRTNGLIITAEPTFEYLRKTQDRIVDFIVSHSKAKREEIVKRMNCTDNMANDVGTVLFGREAVELGIIDEVGGLSNALKKLREMISLQNVENTVQ